MKDKLDVKYTLEDSNGNKYTILDTQRVDLQEELNKEIEKQAKEINRLHSIIKEVREYIEKYLQDHVIEDSPDEQSIFYDEKDNYIPNAKEQILEILDKVGDEV